MLLVIAVASIDPAEHPCSSKTVYQTQQVSGGKLQEATEAKKARIQLQEAAEEPSDGRIPIVGFSD